LLYGTTLLGGGAGCGGAGCGTIFRLNPTDSSFEILHTFGEPDGRYPSGPLLEALDGTFYGAGSGGGTGCGGDGCGVAFKIDQAGAFSVVHVFNGSDGRLPTRFLQAADGGLYATTILGGGTGCLGNGCGTIFSMDPTGAITTLHVFSGPDGNGPGGLIQAVDGALYGATVSGGSRDQGVVYRLRIP